MISSIYAAARERGKYEALGGHRARGSLQVDHQTGRTLCGVCRRPLTWREDRHAPRKTIRAKRPAR